MSDTLHRIKIARRALLAACASLAYVPMKGCLPPAKVDFEGSISKQYGVIVSSGCGVPYCSATDDRTEYAVPVFAETGKHIITRLPISFSKMGDTRHIRILGTSKDGKHLSIASLWMTKRRPGLYVDVIDLAGTLRYRSILPGDPVCLRLSSRPLRLFVSVRTEEIGVIDIYTNEGDRWRLLRKVRPNPIGLAPLFDISADGETIAYDDDGFIYSHHVSTDDQRQISQGHSPTLSPGGEHLAYVNPESRLAVCSFPTLQNRSSQVIPCLDGVAWSPDSSVGIMAQRSMYTGLKQRFNDIYAISLPSLEKRLITRVPGSIGAGAYHWVARPRLVADALGRWLEGVQARADNPIAR